MRDLGLIRTAITHDSPREYVTYYYTTKPICLAIYPMLTLSSFVCPPDFYLFGSIHSLVH